MVTADCCLVATKVEGGGTTAGGMSVTASFSSEEESLPDDSLWLFMGANARTDSTIMTATANSKREEDRRLGIIVTGVSNFVRQYPIALGSFCQTIQLSFSSLFH